MTRITIPTGNWHLALADAIENSTRDTVIVVHSQAMLELAQAAAERLGKPVRFEVLAPPDPLR